MCGFVFRQNTHTHTPQCRSHMMKPFIALSSQLGVKNGTVCMERILFETPLCRGLGMMDEGLLTRNGIRKYPQHLLTTACPLGFTALLLQEFHVCVCVCVLRRSWQGLHMEAFISSLSAGSRTPPPPLSYQSSTFVLTAADRHHFLPPS